MDRVHAPQGVSAGASGRVCGDGLGQRGGGAGPPGRAIWARRPPCTTVRRRSGPLPTGHPPEGGPPGCSVAAVGRRDDLCLETPRLLLRPPRAADFDGWAAFMADPDTARFVGGAQPRPASWRGFLAVVGAWEVQGFGMFSVIERASGDWVGRLGPWMPEGWPGPEVGWGIARERWGLGYATEGSAAAIGWAFDALGWTEVIHCIDPENHASERVAERLGSRPLRRATLPPPFTDAPVMIWGQSRDEWRARGA